VPRSATQLGIHHIFITFDKTSGCHFITVPTASAPEKVLSLETSLDGSMTYRSCALGDESTVLRNSNLRNVFKLQTVSSPQNGPLCAARARRHEREADPVPAPNLEGRLRWGGQTAFAMTAIVQRRWMQRVPPIGGAWGRDRPVQDVRMPSSSSLR
jgi:hypothetical protein